MKRYKKYFIFILFLFHAILAQTSQDQTNKPVESQSEPLVRYRIQVGDLNGDGVYEVVSWNSESREMVVMDYSKGKPEKLTSFQFENFPSLMKVADLNGDKKGELVIGEGLVGYNPKTGPQTDIHIRIHKPLEKGGWTSNEIFRKASIRPRVTTLEIVDIDGNGVPEILFSYFANKYFVDICIAHQEGNDWKVQKLETVRMGMHVTAGDIQGDRKKEVIVGRPYGEEQTALGGVFVMEEGSRVTLPNYRGVSSVAIGDVDGDDQNEVIIGDGWHSDFGKIARARISILKRVEDKWEYKLLEDVPEHIRINTIELFDLDGDGKAEIIAHGQRVRSLGGDVRVYQLVNSGWLGKTVASDVQGFAVGSVSGDGKPEIIFSGREHRVFAPDLSTAEWDAHLGEEVHTYEVDPESIIGKRAPNINAEEWIGTGGLSLENLKGKVILLDFWATWCTPCIATFPLSKEWDSKYKDNGLVIIGATNFSNQTSEQIRSFVEKHELPWVTAIDPSSRLHMDYGVSSIPHMFLLDRKGIVRLSHKGNENLERVDKMILKLLDEK
jgi:thiol-disulfide isomerase/thioredoxin